MKVILVVIIIVAIITGGWWYLSRQQAGSVDTYSSSTSSASAFGSSKGTPADTHTISASDSSDAALQGDMASMDTQLKALDNDSSNVDQGMNDQQIPQA